MYKAAQELQNSGAEKWGGFGGEVSHGFPPLTLSQHGPITYTIYAYFRAYYPSCNNWAGLISPPYEGGWDGWDSYSHTVQRPAIAGFAFNGAMWYLGPGTAAQVQGQDGNYHPRAYTLGLDTKCDPSSACTETPR